MARDVCGVPQGDFDARRGRRGKYTTVWLFLFFSDRNLYFNERTSAYLFIDHLLCWVSYFQTKKIGRNESENGRESLALVRAPVAPFQSSSSSINCFSRSNRALMNLWPWIQRLGFIEAGLKTLVRPKDLGASLKKNPKLEKEGNPSTPSWMKCSPNGTRISIRCHQGHRGQR